ncbi:MAG: penicillin-binding protein 1A [Gomphosphaeria aponina SAG 52.96 = DSM 107014]|uniref:Penicillin-binding protein 1A n=1 Tax=Gomphosphaeria aponina SAG 52.96 = DSM 107014 TaxID=1521640 RepID=A0A941JKS0_9CHRO|nr:penicillin-binding protein 1A [Gomphosphaeria aponina SAG 52.96 = DSM 107014]
MSFSTLEKQEELKKKLEPVARFSLGVAKVAGGTILGLSMLVTTVVAGGVVGLALSFRNLPDVRILRSYVPTETSYIYDVKGRLLTSLHGEAHRKVVKLDDISPQLKQAVIAVEDSHFYQHDGIYPNSIARAFLVNWQQGGVSQGASTLTMQLVKNLFLSRERVFTRKLAEAVLAIRVEQIFTKDEILEMYLNNIYWGHNSYGVEIAAESYFNKSASELTLAEATMMAGLIQAPEQYSPFINYKETKERQAVVLKRMEELGWITAPEAEAAFKEPLLVAKPTAWQNSKAPYVTDLVIEQLNEIFGPEAVLKGGIRVQTTVDYNLQQMAQAVVQKEHKNLLNQGVDADQVALVAVDPRTHFVKAVVGGVDYNKSKFNRATQSRRQPGSSFKPFVYYTAFASGKYTPASLIEDREVKYRDGDNYYIPQNYGGKFLGQMNLTEALIQSRNIPAIELGQAVGLDKVIAATRAVGIKSPLEAVVSLPLGSMGVTPLEMAGAYATFASNGWHCEPTMILRVTDSSGKVLIDNTPQPKLVLNPWATATLTSELQKVIESGTGRKAKIDRQAAGKTGTTNSERDVWFVGYVPQLATAVWVGNDDYRPIGKGITGGDHAAPIWRAFMLEALKNEPVEEFTAPSAFSRPQP